MSTENLNQENQQEQQKGKQKKEYLNEYSKAGNIISEIEKSQLRDDIPSFRAGDTVVVNVNVVEGNTTRKQAFEGVVIAKKNRGLNSSFTVRKIASGGVGVERTFITHSAMIDSVKVIRRGSVRRAKLYYLRALSGRKARIKENVIDKSKSKKSETPQVQEVESVNEQQLSQAQTQVDAQENQSPKNATDKKVEQVDDSSSKADSK